MVINGQEVDVDTLVNNLDLDSQFLKKRENGMYLNDYQVSVLERNQISYLEYPNLSSLIFAIQEQEDIEDPELEQVLEELQELHYYKETHK